MSYIEREKAFDAVFGQFCASSDETEAALNAAIDEIKAIPAADVREVIKANWVEEEKDGVWHEYCSNCREHIPKGKWGQPWHSSYCPHCGAEMER